MVVEEVCAGKLVDRKSKFYGHLYKIDNIESDVSEVQKIHNKKYKKAAHHCYAALCGDEEDSRNDGEVGSPGRVLLELLQEYNLNGYMIMISRKFGGIKLGQGGVARAFRNTGRGVIEAYISKKS